MTLYLDTGKVEEAKIAARLGWTKGITTNPILLSQSSLPPAETLRQLAGATDGPVFYQLVSDTVAEMLQEAERAREILGSQLHLKIPPTDTGFEAVSRLSQSTPCIVTAVYSPAQAMIAQAAGAIMIALYFHRTMSLLEGGLHLVKEIKDVLDPNKTCILAASLKSPGEAVVVRQEGIEHLTLPLSVLQAMTQHELSANTATEFAQKGVGLRDNA
ncbi:MAG: transaldolase [Chloroflexi bacterium]|nr:transaldolase [Chloroflexota bacterium]